MKISAAAAKAKTSMAGENAEAKIIGVWRQRQRENRGGSITARGAWRRQARRGNGVENNISVSGIGKTEGKARAHQHGAAQYEKQSRRWRKHGAPRCRASRAHQQRQ